MLHIIGQMRNMFMASIVGYFENPDRNNNTRLDEGDFSGLTAEQQKQIIESLWNLWKAWMKALKTDNKAYVDFTNATLVSNGQAEKIRGRHVKDYNKIAEVIASSRWQVLKPRKDFKAEVWNGNSVDPLAGTQMLADSQAGKTAEGNEAITGRIKMPNINSKREVRGVQKFLKDRGIMGANGEPLSVDGSWGPNSQAAFDAYNASVGSKPSKKITESRNNESWDKNLFGHNLNKNKFRWLSDIENQINARNNPELLALDKAITDISNSSDFNAIHRVYEQAKTLLQSKLDSKTYKIFLKAKNATEEAYALSFVSNALMGWRSSRNAVESWNSKDRVQSLKASSNDAIELIESLGLSPGLVWASQEHIQMIASALERGVKINKKTTNISDGELAFSTRTRKWTQKLQWFGSGAMDYLSGAYDVPETKNDQKTFIDNMSIAQLKEIASKIGGLNANKYEEFRTKLKSMVDSGDANKGTIHFDIKLVIADNCNNVSYISTFKYEKKTPAWNGGDGSGGGGGGGLVESSNPGGSEGTGGIGEGQSF